MACIRRNFRHSAYGLYRAVDETGSGDMILALWGSTSILPSFDLVKVLSNLVRVAKLCKPMTWKSTLIFNVFNVKKQHVFVELPIYRLHFLSELLRRLLGEKEVFGRSVHWSFWWNLPFDGISSSDSLFFLSRKCAEFLLGEVYIGHLNSLPFVWLK